MAFQKFSLREYCSDPAYPAVLHVQLSATPIPAVGTCGLGTFPEMTFKGYKQHAGTREQLFGPPEVTPKWARLTSKGLIWVNKGAAPVTIATAVVVATFPGEASQLVELVNVGRTLAQGNGVKVQFTLTSETITF